MNYNLFASLLSHCCALYPMPAVTPQPWYPLPRRDNLRTGHQCPKTYRYVIRPHCPRTQSVNSGSIEDWLGCPTWLLAVFFIVLYPIEPYLINPTCHHGHPNKIRPTRRRFGVMPSNTNIKANLLLSPRKTPADSRLRVGVNITRGQVICQGNILSHKSALIVLTIL